MSAILFLDTETTGLSLDDDIWEFAAIRREHDGSETEHHLFIQHDPGKCKALPESFRADHEARWRGMDAVSPRFAAAVIAELTEDHPHIVGAVPNFDAERLTRLLSKHSQKWGGHYHLIDVENLAVGFLAGLHNHGHSEVTCTPLCGNVDRLPSLPWDSDELSRAVGVEPPGDGVRHTAMGDVRWARAIYDRVMGGGS